MIDVSIVSKIVSRKTEGKELSKTPSMPGSFLEKSIWDSIFEIKVDTVGNRYLFGKLPLATQYGITMFAEGDIKIPSLLDSIPIASTSAKGLAYFDPNYFSVGNDGKVSLIVGGQGIDETELEAYLTSNNYAKKSDIPSLVGYATESWVNTRIASLINGAPAAYDTLKEIADVLQGNVSSIGDIITALGTKWTQDNTKIANWDTAYSWGNHANAGYALKSYVDNELTKYVTLSGEQTISGKKNFTTGGLFINGSQIIYDSTKKYWKLEGDLLVTGGITMYGNDSEFTPSTIMDAIATDNVNLKVVDGVLTFIGQTGGGVADSVAWSGITGKPTTLSGYGITDAKISNGVITLGGSTITPLTSHQTIYNLTFQAGTFSAITFDPNGAAKTVNIPTTTSHISEGTNLYYTDARAQTAITGGASTITTSNLTKSRALISNSSGKVAVSAVTSTELGYLDGVTSAIQTQLNGKLSLTGGTINGSGDYLYVPLFINALNDSISGITFKTNGTEKGHVGYSSGLGIRLHSSTTAGIAVSDSNVPIFYTGDGSVKNTLWHSGNDGSGSGLDADLLDGYHVDSLLKGVYDANINFNSFSDDNNVNNFYYIHDGLNQSNKPYDYGGLLQLGISTMNVQVGFDHKNAACLRTRWWSSNGYDWNSWREFAFTDSNVASATKLQTARTIWGQNFDGTSNLIGTAYIGQNTNGAATIDAFNGKAYYGCDAVANGAITSTTGAYIAIDFKTGFIGVGTPNPSYKLDVNGHSRLDGWLKTGGVIETYQEVGGTGQYSYLKLNTKYVYDSGEWASYVVSDYYGANWCATGGFTHGMYFKSGRYGFDNFIFLDSQGNPVARLSTTSGAGNHHFMGNVLASGGFTMYSDKRKKTILGNVELSLKDIANAPLIEHYYNSDINKTTHIGSIAQYWASMNDWFCKLDNEGFYTMEIQNCALASAISIARELDRYETKTDKAIKKLKKRICELEEEVERLKSA